MLSEDDLEHPGYKLWRAKIVHALRAALDHTAYALVQLPIYKDAMPGGKPLDRTHPSKLLGVDRKVLAQANWLQPYRRGGELDRLWIVHALDIIDKHRRLNVVHPAVLKMVVYYGAFKDGAVVARYRIDRTGDGHVRMETNFAFDVTFGEAKPPIAGEPVMRTLETLLTYTGGVIARFERFFP